jgi:hypothetical protein
MQNPEPEVPKQEDGVLDAEPEVERHGTFHTFEILGCQGISMSMPRELLKPRAMNDLTLWYGLNVASVFHCSSPCDFWEKKE